MDSSRLAELGLLKVCRACLSDEGEMKTVFNNNKSDQEPLWKQIQYISSIEINETDGLPGLICISCEIRLNTAYEFRKQCQKSYTTLKKYIDNALLSNLKNEITVEETILDEAYNMKEECVEVLQENIQQDDSESDDLDDKPLIYRREPEKQRSVLHFAEEVVNKAIVASKQKYNQKKECRLCGFISSNARGLSLHIAHLHKELKERWCGVCYQEVDNLPQHLTQHSKTKSYICTFCGKGFSSQGHLTEHMRSHSSERPYKCTDCSKGFLSARHLRVHERIHSGVRPYVCPHCGRSFTQNGSLQGHIRTHTGLKPFRCEHCDKRCTTSSSLASHRVKTGHIMRRTKLTVPTEEIEHIRKPIVGSREPMDSLNVLQDPIEDVNLTEGSESIKLLQESTNEAILLCESKESVKISSCITNDNIIFLSEADSNRISPPDDIDPVNNETLDDSTDVTFINDKPQEKLFKNEDFDDCASLFNTDKKLCTVCGKTFSTASKLRLHTRVHTGETPYKCQHCDKRFSTRGQLVVHVRTHTGERPHVCHVCGKGFAQSSVLNTHMKLHTGRPEQCRLCERRFCRPAELRLHMRRHTGEKPYLCAHCGQAFVQRSHLVEHAKTHSDERPYKCNLCERAFKQSSSLKSHVQIHTGHKPYRCSQCAYACRQSYALTQHMRQHEGDPPRADRPHRCVACHRAFTTAAMLNSHARQAHNALF